MLKNIFSPIEIGKLRIPNRLVVPAMVTNYCNGDGTAAEKYVVYHEAKARGGWGLIITEDYAVLANGLRIERDGREEKIGPFDTVILAVGVQPCNDLTYKLEGKVARLITIGDASTPRKALEAIGEGYLAGLEV